MIERTKTPALSRPPGYSHVVVGSGTRLVATAGVVPLDAEGNLVGPGDVVQTRQVLDNLSRTLGATGSDVADAASTLLGVSLLGYEGRLVEIEALTVLE